MPIPARDGHDGIPEVEGPAIRGLGFHLLRCAGTNIFATLGIIVAHSYAYLTHTGFKPGIYVLFAVLCAAASYIAVPAVQRLAIPEASPTLPLAASLGLTFSYNVTIGIPLYIAIAPAPSGTGSRSPDAPLLSGTNDRPLRSSILSSTSWVYIALVSNCSKPATGSVAPSKTSP